MYILFDIGGTKMRLAGSRDGSSLLFDKLRKTDTPIDDFEAGISIFEKLVREISEGEKIEGIAGGIAGPLDREKGVLLNSPNIRGWVGKPLKKRLEDIFKVPVFIENDAALVGLGEAHYGAGRGSKILGYITVSTGVGGARIVDGKIDRSIFGFEPGHQIVIDSTRSLESIISGAALKKKFNKEPKDIHEESVWDEEAQLLAYGLNNIAVLWSPDTIILGGSMVVRRPGISVDKVREYFEKTLTIFPKKPILKEAKLKDEGGLYGALAHLTSSIK